ncbi:MAG: Mg2+ and Co2+ transporter CorB [Clostridia bacterium]|nr:Mg2+ and Co2+ transporter CorB [Clostridia bacterium]
MQETDKTPPRSHRKTKQDRLQQKKKERRRWILTAFLLSFFITAAISVVTGEIAEAKNVALSLPLLVLFILIGVLFDVIGLAVATAEASPFHSMASRRLKTGKKAVWLIQNSPRVTSFCNDIIGDICGVVSGAMGSVIAAQLFIGAGAFWLTLSLTSLIAAMTIGLKAVGKHIAMENSEKIVLAVAKVLCGFRK